MALTLSQACISLQAWAKSNLLRREGRAVLRHRTSPLGDRVRRHVSGDGEAAAGIQGWTTPVIEQRQRRNNRRVTVEGVDTVNVQPGVERGPLRAVPLGNPASWHVSGHGEPA